MDLLERFAAGDLEAFEVLFRQHQSQVYAWIVRIVRDSGIAEDLTVETFWRIYRSRARFDPAGNFGAWTYRIASNAALDHLRKSRRETELPADLAADPEPDSAVQHETRDRIRKAFAQLPPKYRLVATLASDRRRALRKNRRGRRNLRFPGQSPGFSRRAHVA